MVKVSVIIPVKEINDYIRKFIPFIIKQTFSDFEIIILPNSKTSEKFPKTRIVTSGNLGPAAKRDLGVKKSKGEIIAFIDDDAYPKENWLKNALKLFKDKEVAMVGGPNVTPLESNFFQKVSGEVLSSYIVSGPVNYRYKSSKARECDDLPSCNMLVRKDIFLKVGGFDTGFWPGEDTKLCLEIKRLNKKILYSPDLIVYHHRRNNFSGYIKQMLNYAIHRGYFAKKGDENSLRLRYFVPSFFVLGLVLGPLLSLISPIFETIYFLVLSLYFLLLIVGAIRTKKVEYILPFIFIGFITHLVYGVGILFGFLKMNIKNKYR